MIRIGKPPTLVQLRARGPVWVPPDRPPGSGPVVVLDDAEIERLVTHDRFRGLVVRRLLAALWTALAGCRLLASSAELLLVLPAELPEAGPLRFRHDVILCHPRTGPPAAAAGRLGA